MRAYNKTLWDAVCCGPFGGGGSTSTTVVEAQTPTAEETELINRQIELADFQLQELQRQSALQETAFDELGPLLDIQTAEAERQAERALALEPVQDELLQLQLEQIRRGGAASPEQIEAINEATGEALSQGESDILRFTGLAQEQLREELAGSLGLRPGDTPILDRGARIATEGVRQQGQLASGLREANATARLNFPLASAQVFGAQNQFQQSLAQSAQEFSAQLRDAATLNRLRLGQTQGSLGLGLATGIPGNLGAISSNLASRRGSTSTTSTSGGGLGLGSILSAASTLGHFVVPSSRAIKENNTPINEVSALEALMALPVEAWNYIGDNTTHIGVMAEDFQDKTGLGDGKTISVVDALGLVMAATQTLTKRVKELEHV